MGFLQYQRKIAFAHRIPQVSLWGIYCNFSTALVEWVI